MGRDRPDADHRAIGRERCRTPLDGTCVPPISVALISALIDGADTALHGDAAEGAEPRRRPAEPMEQERLDHAETARVNLLFPETS